MIKIKKHLEDFKTIVGVISNITITDVNLTFNEDGITVRVVDGTNANLLLLKLKKEMFDVYEIDKPNTYTINSLMLNKVVRHIAKDGKELELEIKNEGFVMKNSKNNFLLSYYVGLEDVRPMPQISITSKWNIDMTEFLNIIEGFKEFGEIFKVVGKDKLVLHVKGASIEGETITESKLINGEEDESWYGISYFVNILDMKSILKNVELGFSTGGPCELDYSNDWIDFKWILAGRVDENEDK